VDGPIAWGEMGKLAGVQVRCGRGRSGLRYHVRKRPGNAGAAAEWRIGVVGANRELDIGSARMEDHALALAGMWEDAVLGGRIDMS
jgi:hypothetical protein